MGRYTTYVEAHHERSTRAIVSRVLDDFGRHWGEDRPIEELTVEHLDQFQARRRRGTLKLEVSKSQTNKLCRHLIAFLNWCASRIRDAEGNSVLKRDPTLGFVYLRPDKRRKDAKSSEEIAKLLQELRASGDHDVEDWLWIGANTGARYSEIMAVRVRDCDFWSRLDERGIRGRLWLQTYGGHRLKDREDRVVPMNDALYRVLAWRCWNAGHDPDALLFSDARRHWAMLKALREAAARASIGRTTFQIIRRSFASLGADFYTPFQLQALLGWSDSSVGDEFYIEKERMKIPPPPNVGDLPHGGSVMYL